MINGFNVTINEPVAVVKHPSKPAIYLVIIKTSAQSNFNFISALQFYLVPQSEPVMTDSIIDLFTLIKNICPELVVFQNTM